MMKNVMKKGKQIHQIQRNYYSAKHFYSQIKSLLDQHELTTLLQLAKIMKIVAHMMRPKIMDLIVSYFIDLGTIASVEDLEALLKICETVEYEFPSSSFMIILKKLVFVKTQYQLQPKKKMLKMYLVLRMMIDDSPNLALSTKIYCAVKYCTNMYHVSVQNVDDVMTDDQRCQNKENYPSLSKYLMKD